MGNIPNGPILNDQFETKSDLLEHFYWEFNTARTGESISERDAFKAVALGVAKALVLFEADQERIRIHKVLTEKKAKQACQYEQEKVLNGNQSLDLFEDPRNQPIGSFENCIYKDHDPFGFAVTAKSQAEMQSPEMDIREILEEQTRYLKWDRINEPDTFNLRIDNKVEIEKIEKNDITSWDNTSKPRSNL